MSGVTDTLATPVVASVRQPVGYRQLTAASSTSLVPIPIGAKRALIRCETQAVRYRDDGTAPTAAIGFPLAVGDVLEYTGDLTAIKFIEQAASTALNVLFYE